MNIRMTKKAFEALPVREEYRDRDYVADQYYRVNDHVAQYREHSGAYGAGVWWHFNVDFE